MRYTQGVVSAPAVQELIVTSEQVINDVVKLVTPRLVSADTRLVRRSLGDFVEGDIVDTYENIAFFAQQDMLAFLEGVTSVLSDNVLSMETKIDILNWVLDDKTDVVQELSFDDIKNGAGEAYDKAKKGAGEAYDKAKSSLGDTSDKALAYGRAIKKGVGDFANENPGTTAAIAGGAAALGYGAYKGAKALRAKMAARKSAR